MLYDPERHEPLTDAPWDEARARVAIAEIVRDVHAAYGGPAALWPIHPLDRSPERPNPMKALYYGAAGVIWALRRLEAQGFAAPGPDYLEAAVGLADAMRADALRLTGAPQPGYLLGEGGALLLHWALAPSEAVAAALAADIEAAIGHPSLGFAWGGAGAMKAALVMHERTGEGRWLDLVARHAEALWQAWVFDETAGCWLWTHDLYGAAEQRLGALHGFAGTAGALLQAAHLLPDDRRAELPLRIAQTLAATARREGAFANWPMSADVTDGPYAEPRILQHCMGAPGMINALAALPADPEIDALFRAGGELTWAAGPVAKLPGLCHGVPGAGYAFLNLFARTGDEVWLTRARGFAVHAVAQADRAKAEHGQRKYSVWTGDLGLALYLADCIAGASAFPMQDVF